MLEEVGVPYRTEILDSTTREEANCFALKWIKQRSRWLKGYMVTYLVHMRRPGRLLRDLGLWRFALSARRPLHFGAYIQKWPTV